MKDNRPLILGGPDIDLDTVAAFNGGLHRTCRIFDYAARFVMKAAMSNWTNQIR